MANQKRETPEEKARRERQEYIDLLKMKQGLIEESELIPEIGYEEIPELHGWAKVKNYIYHNKWFILLGAFFAAVVIILLVQILTKEKYDLNVLLIANKKSSDLGVHTDQLERALEKYCPDFDGNGKVNVSVNYINNTMDEVATQYDQANKQKLTAELTLAEAQLIITDDGYSKFTGSLDEITEIFLEQSENAPSDMLYENCGVIMNKTGFAKEARWSKCPDDIMLFVREELNNGSGSIKENAKNRERASIVLQNIIDNNIINPDTVND